MKKIICFDMDMTLLDHKDFKIPRSAMRALDRLRGRHYIVIATGRDLQSKFSAGLTELVRPDAVINLNGTKVTVGEQTIYEHEMAPGLVKRLLDFAQGRPFAIGMTTGTADYYVNPEYVQQHDIRRFGRSDRAYLDPRLLLEMPVRTLTYVGSAKYVPEVEAAFPELKLPLFSSRTGADIVEKEASKAEGLKRLCKYYRIPLAETVAFGDSMNDIEIIRTAGIGVAMGNAIEAVKAAADYVTTPIGDDGVWNACVHFGLIEP